MKILKESPKNKRLQALEQALDAADDKYKATKKELENFKWDLVDRGYWKHNWSAFSEWEQVKKLTLADQRKLKDLEAKEEAARKEYEAAVDEYQENV